MDKTTKRNHRRYEDAEMQEERFGCFPKRFGWRGKNYVVEAVEQCWTITKPSTRLCFRVRCVDGTFDLTFDTRKNFWRAAQV